MQEKLLICYVVNSYFCGMGVGSGDTRLNKLHIHGKMPLT